MVTQLPLASSNDNEPLISFSHVQLYVDHVEDLQVYKALENRLNAFAEAAKDCATLEERKRLWTKSHTGTDNPVTTSFSPENRDVVLQLLSSFGFRVTGARFTNHTRSVLVTSRDPKGVQILVTSAVNHHLLDAQVKENPFGASPGIFARGELWWPCHFRVSVHFAIFLTT